MNPNIDTTHPNQHNKDPDCTATHDFLNALSLAFHKEIEQEAIECYNRRRMTAWERVRGL
jgi:hypothetical protein